MKVFKVEGTLWFSNFFQWKYRVTLNHWGRYGFPSVLLNKPKKSFLKSSKKYQYECLYAQQDSNAQYVFLGKGILNWALRYENNSFAG